MIEFSRISFPVLRHELYTVVLENLKPFLAHIVTLEDTTWVSRMGHDTLGWTVTLEDGP